MTTAQKATNITWHEGNVTREERQKNLGHKGVTLWMTGLSASGKSTIAVALEQVLLQRGYHAYRLDGDNIRRIGEVAKLFSDAGLITITSFISPYKADRDNARKLHDEAKLPFLEVFVDLPIEVAEQRDPKGLYKKARAGQIKGFTGIDDPYEAPVNAELHLRTDQLSIEESVQKLIDLLESRGCLKG